MVEVRVIDREGVGLVTIAYDWQISLWLAHMIDRNGVGLVTCSNDWQKVDGHVSVTWLTYKLVTALYDWQIGVGLVTASYDWQISLWLADMIDRKGVGLVTTSYDLSYQHTLPWQRAAWQLSCVAMALMSNYTTSLKSRDFPNRLLLSYWGTQAVIKIQWVWLQFQLHWQLYWVWTFLGNLSYIEWYILYIYYISYIEYYVSYIVQFQLHWVLTILCKTIFDSVFHLFQSNNTT